MGTPKNDKKKRLGEIAHESGLCNICLKRPIFYEKSTVKCEHCFAVSHKAVKRWVEQHKDRMKEYQKKNRSKPENKTKNKLRQREYRKTEQYKTYYANYYQNNITRMHEKDRNWAKSNPDKVRLKAKTHTNKRRYAKRHNGGSGHISIKQWNELLSIFGNQCINCGTTNRIELDHIIPLAKNGQHDINNIQPLCHTCNIAKGTDIIDYRISYFSSWT